MLSSRPSFTFPSMSLISLFGSKVTSNDPTRKALYNYCKEVAADLDAKKGLVGKYYRVASTLPEEKYACEEERLQQIKKQEEADKKARDAFLQKEDSAEVSPAFAIFYDELISTVRSLNTDDQDDIETIGKNDETAKAKAFRECVEQLNKAGFYTANGKPINFWSGTQAQEKANGCASAELSNENVPAFAVVAQAGNLSKDIDRNWSDKLFKAISALFAMQAVGIVAIYSSACNINEKEPILTMNNFNTVEVGRAQYLLRQGKVKQIVLFHYNHEMNAWPKQGVDINEGIKLVKRRPSTDLPALDLSMISSPRALSPSFLNGQSAESKRQNTLFWQKDLKSPPRVTVHSTWVKSIYTHWNGLSTDKSKWLVHNIKLTCHLIKAENAEREARKNKINQQLEACKAEVNAQYELIKAKITAEHETIKTNINEQFEAIKLSRK